MADVFQERMAMSQGGLLGEMGRRGPWRGTGCLRDQLKGLRDRRDDGSEGRGEVKERKMQSYNASFQLGSLEGQGCST